MTAERVEATCEIGTPVGLERAAARVEHIEPTGWRQAPSLPRRLGAQS